MAVTSLSPLTGTFRAGRAAVAELTVIVESPGARERCPRGAARRGGEERHRRKDEGENESPGGVPASDLDGAPHAIPCLSLHLGRIGGGPHRSGQRV